MFDYFLVDFKYGKPKTSSLTFTYQEIIEKLKAELLFHDLPPDASISLPPEPALKDAPEPTTAPLLLPSANVTEKDFHFLKRLEVSINEMLDEFHYYNNSLKTINQVFELRKIHKQLMTQFYRI